MIYGGHFDIDNKLNEVKSLEVEVNNPNLWDNQDYAKKVIDKYNGLKKLINNVIGVKASINNCIESLLIIENDFDDEIFELIVDELGKIEEDVGRLEIELLLSGEYDSGNCILEVHAGAGGTEACDWAMMLYRMYNRWALEKGYKVEVLDYQDGDEAGLKRASIVISGTNAYGYLKCEKGVHRLVRLSPFDANNKRHTSFASIDVTPEIDDNVDIEIKEEDLKIDVYRSSGAGGQSVNTTDSAVRITYLPLKLVVTCQNERSQIKNKEKAISILKGKLKLLEMENKEKEMANIKGENKNIEFGSQIRSYVMHPYSMVKDHRTNIETSNVSKVLDGDIDNFINGFLRRK